MLLCNIVNITIYNITGSFQNLSQKNSGKTTSGQTTSPKKIFSTERFFTEIFLWFFFNKSCFVEVFVRSVWNRSLYNIGSVTTQKKAICPIINFSFSQQTLIMTLPTAKKNNFLVLKEHKILSPMFYLLVAFHPHALAPLISSFLFTFVQQCWPWIVKEKSTS